jgi:hypothetical protein
MRSRGALAKYNKLVDFGNTGVVSGCTSGECKVYRMINGVKTLISTISKEQEYEYLKENIGFESFALPGSPLKGEKKR